MSRSEFFARAAQFYLAELDEESLTHQIDQAIGTVEQEESSSEAVAVGRRWLAGECQGTSSSPQPPAAPGGVGPESLRSLVSQADLRRIVVSK